jgi:hypothetical protein
VDRGTDPVGALYFSVVTITTVGYGDFVPCGTPGWLLAVAEIATSVAFVLVLAPLLLSVFAAELRAKSNSNEMRSPTLGKIERAGP